MARGYQIETRWRTLKVDIDLLEVRQICAKHGIDVKEFKSVTGSFGKKILFIN